MTETDILLELCKYTINEVDMLKRWFYSVLALGLVFEGEDAPLGSKAVTAQVSAFFWHCKTGICLTPAVLVHPSIRISPTSQ